MKRLIFAVLFVGLLVFAVSFIPNNPSIAYPPSTPLPPTYVEPMWFGIYCDYPGAIPPNEGYISIKWDETFPSGYAMDTVDPGTVTVYYPSTGYKYYNLLITENYVSHWWGTLWNPPENEVAEISGYVRIRPIGGGPASNVTVLPDPAYQFCPPFVYLPMIMR